MKREMRAYPLLLGVLCLVACASDSEPSEEGPPADPEAMSDADPATIHDTTGQAFTLNCGKFPCDAVPVGSAPTCGRGETFFLFGRGIATVCKMLGSQGQDTFTYSPSDCRPVACHAVAECPKGRHCIDRMCQIPPPPGPIDKQDVDAICVADLPWSAGCGVGAESQALFDRVRQEDMECPDVLKCDQLPSVCMHR